MYRQTHLSGENLVKRDEKRNQLVELVLLKRKIFTKMFIRKRGKTKFMWLPVTTSTAISKGALVAWSSGKLIAATSTTSPTVIAGVLRHAIASSDSDYATDRLVEVEVPLENFVEWEADTASAVSTDLGGYVDLTNSLTVNRGASSYDVCLIVGLISATKIRVVLNIGPAGFGIGGAS